MDDSTLAFVTRPPLPTMRRFTSACGRTRLIPEADVVDKPPSYAGRVSRERMVDLALAVLCAVLSTAAVAGGLLVTTQVAGGRWWTVPVFLVPAVALLVRRTSPLLCVVGVWVPVALHAVLTGHGAEGVFLVLPAWASLYALAAYGSRRQLVAGLGVAIASLAVHDVFDPSAWQAGAEAAWAAAFWDLLLFVPPLVGGWVSGVRRADRLAEQNAALELRRAEETHAAVSDERARIARELHDSVTHNVNIVILQAMAAAGVLAEDPEKARDPLAVIERSAREALAEMRRMLGVLREVDGDVLDTDPQRGVQDLAGLLDGARDSGINVELAVEGDERRVEPAMALTLYRIVQESLSNAAAHALGSRVLVRLRFESDAVDVSVTDDGGGGASTSGSVSASRGPGFGLAGMRERVAVFGGSLDVGACDQGGFCVHARLPLGGPT